MYADLSDDILVRSMYAKAGIPTKEWNPSPLGLLIKVAALAMGFPLGILLFGGCLSWALRGFRP